MKLKVEVKFRDKNNGKLYNVGDVVEFSDERASELLKDSRKLVSKVKEEKKEAEAKPKATAKPKGKNLTVLPVF